MGLERSLSSEEDSWRENETREGNDQHPSTSRALFLSWAPHMIRISETSLSSVPTTCSSTIIVLVLSSPSRRPLALVVERSDSNAVKDRRQRTHPQ